MPWDFVKKGYDLSHLTNQNKLTGTTPMNPNGVFNSTEFNWSIDIKKLLAKVTFGIVFCVGVPILSLLIFELEKKFLQITYIDTLLLAIIVSAAINNLCQIPNLIKIGSKTVSKFGLELAILLLG